MVAVAVTVDVAVTVCVLVTVSVLVTAAGVWAEAVPQAAVSITPNNKTPMKPFAHFFILHDL
jgi:hypothetical protein